MQPRSRRSLLLLVLFLGVGAFLGGLWLWRQFEDPVSAPGMAGPESGNSGKKIVASEPDATNPELAGNRRELGTDPDTGWVVRGEVRNGSRTKERWPGAKLIAEVFRGYTADGEPELRSELVSDADGRIRWPMPAPDHTVTLRFRPGDPKLVIFARDQEHLVVGGQPAPQDLVIEVQPLLCRLSGLVVDQQDRPIAKARIFCSSGMVLTDVQGRFEAALPSWSF